MKRNLWALLGVGVTLVLVLAASKPSWTQPLSSCVPSSERLCLNDGRFGVEVDWEIEDGSNGRGAGEALTDETGYFWFFNEENVEVVVKVLDACAVNDHYWIFAAGLTNVRTTILVEHRFRLCLDADQSSGSSLSAYTRYGSLPVLGLSAIGGESRFCFVQGTRWMEDWTRTRSVRSSTYFGCLGTGRIDRNDCCLVGVIVRPWS